LPGQSLKLAASKLRYDQTRLLGLHSAGVPRNDRSGRPTQGSLCPANRAPFLCPPFRLSCWSGPRQPAQSRLFYPFGQTSSTTTAAEASRAESGAKAPRSIWSAAIYRRFSEGRACHVRFAMLDYPMFIPRARQACPSEVSLGGTCSSGPLFGGTCLSRPLRNVGLSNVYSPGTTSVPLRSIPRRDLLVRSACPTFDHPWPSAGTEVPRGKRG